MLTVDSDPVTFVRPKSVIFGLAEEGEDALGERLCCDLHGSSLPLAVSKKATRPHVGVAA